jgi:1-deoxy-D-xylulose-5-phosphate synthase
MSSTSTSAPSVLAQVNLPADLKGLSTPELIQLSDEVRSTILNGVSQTGGHLAANLGVVELTVALLHLFSPPTDQIIWDTTHQCYPYKILTGRKDRFKTIRQYGGLSGFLKRDESEYDAYGAGHAGTALSAALGMAAARDAKGTNEHVVAITGDAAISCGISFEALNSLVGTTGRFIVILNDNKWSISANVGSLSRYLSSLLTNPRYNRWKKQVENIATQRLGLGWLRKSYYRAEEFVKGFFLKSVLFEEFGLRYIGPVDGHNMPALLDALTIAKNSDRPILLHVATQKGRGYTFAETQPEKWHGPARFDLESGKPLDPPSKETSYSAVFGEVLDRLATTDPAVVAITAGMPSGTGLSNFSKKFPKRFYDIGIAEEHGVLFAAGLAARGMKPIAAIYSTFLQRAVDCVMHDVCLQHLPVIFCLDRAGVVGNDGPTHHGVFDIPMLRCLPEITIMQPRDEEELANMMYTATRMGKPVVIRYPRGGGRGLPVPELLTEVEVGKASVVKEGQGIQIWALGNLVESALDVAKRMEQAGFTDVGVVNARFVKPLDLALLKEQAETSSHFITMEDGAVTGGFGSAVTEALTEMGFSGRVQRFGWPDEFITHGSVGQLREDHGLTPAAMFAEVLRLAQSPIGHVAG